MFFEETKPKISIRCNYKQKNHDIFNINEIQNEKKNIKKYPDSNSNYNILNCEDNLNYLTFNDYIKNEQAKKINPFQQLEFPNSKKSSIKITQNPGGNQSNKEINYGSKKIINNPYPNNYEKNNSIKIISPFKHKEPVNSIKIIKNPNNIIYNFEIDCFFNNEKEYKNNKFFFILYDSLKKIIYKSKSLIIEKQIKILFKIRNLYLHSNNFTLKFFKKEPKLNSYLKTEINYNKFLKSTVEFEDEKFNFKLKIIDNLSLTSFFEYINFSLEINTIFVFILIN